MAATPQRVSDLAPLPAGTDPAAVSVPVLRDGQPVMEYARPAQIAAGVTLAQVEAALKITTADGSTTIATAPGVDQSADGTVPPGDGRDLVLMQGRGGDSNINAPGVSDNGQQAGDAGRVVIRSRAGADAGGGLNGAGTALVFQNAAGVETGRYSPDGFSAPGVTLGANITAATAHFNTLPGSAAYSTGVGLNNGIPGTPGTGAISVNVGTAITAPLLTLGRGTGLAFGIAADGKIQTNQSAAVTPLGAVTKVLPLFDPSGALLGYVPLYAAASGPTGSLSLDLAAGIDPRLSGGAASLPLFSTRDDATPSYVRNAANWLRGVDLTAVSVWNSVGGNTRVGTAVGRRTVLLANHFSYPAGTSLRFVGSDGATVTAAVASVRYAVGGTDLCIATLAADLPASVTPAQLMPASFTGLVSNSLPVPVAIVNQQKQTLCYELHGVGADDSWLQPVGGARGAYALPIVGGDSGGPVLAVLKGRAVMLSHLYTAGSGPGYAALLTQIQAAAAAAGDALPLADLSPYGDAPALRPPAGALLDWDASVGCYSDAGRTAVAGDGAAVGGVTDRAGSYHGSAAGAARPVRHLLAGGRWCVAHDGTAQQLTLAAGLPIEGTRGFCVCAYSRSPLVQTLLAGGTDTASGPLWANYNGSELMFDGVPPYPAAVLAQDAALHLREYSSGGGTQSVAVDGVVLASMAKAASRSWDRFGGRAAAEFGAAAWSRLMVYPLSQDPAPVRAYLKALYGTP